MDKGHRLTDEILEELEKEIEEVYGGVLKELKEELKGTLNWKKILNITDRKKRLLEARKRRRLENLIKRMALILQNKNKIAIDLMQDKDIDIFALNYNWGAYYVEHITGFDLGFMLYNRNAIKQLLTKTTPIFTKIAYKGLKDRKEIERDIRRAFSKSLIKGEGINELAKRISKVIDKNKNDSIRIARTETTRIESEGRQKAFNEAQDKGLKLKKRWVSTLDSRTRKSHRKLMGELRELDAKFSNGLDYPGGDGVAKEVINCRCTHTVKLMGIKRDAKRLELDAKLKRMTFEQWEESKIGKKNN